MKGLLLLNGEPPMEKPDIADAEMIVCSDGAYDWAVKYSIIPDIVVGDMDSIISKIPKDIPVLEYKKEKDFSDGEIALDYLIKNGCNNIDIYGGGGFRDDHAFMNYHLLFRALKVGVEAKMRTNYCVFFLTDKSIELKDVKNRTISIVPFFGNAHILSLEGFKFPLENTMLDSTSSITLSNVAISNEVKVRLNSGIIGIFIVNKI